VEAGREVGPEWGVADGRGAVVAVAGSAVVVGTPVVVTGRVVGGVTGVCAAGGVDAVDGDADDLATRSAA